ncbi:carboxymuconolactone decarboxylase family protein [Mucilaginibacter celer]|uniref:Carboxymuconolactone decarboxylase family protein n=1 Tax=Mucilaginibacter celer TaxID=2305508 RepID=A0A494W018_9SPHI|nr:carboxymuconolactone decarboxylase family protein [Mucilaginibacter celer]AYL99090.1 carboxymuconolactone decarboxylase family protein [Mucilaginibacter celer]
MKTLVLPNFDDLPGESKSILEQVKKRLGKIPNLYATIGYSAASLKGMLEFENLLSQEAIFTPKEKEAINLIVSQVNECDYCLAAHTTLAKMRGFSEEETIAIRKTQLPDTRLNMVLKLAQSIAENKGKADQDLVEAFFGFGYKQDALVNLMGLIVVRTFTNYVFINSSIAIDFPLAQSLA